MKWNGVEWSGVPGKHQTTLHCEQPLDPFQSSAACCQGVILHLNKQRQEERRGHGRDTPGARIALFVPVRGQSQDVAECFVVFLGGGTGNFFCCAQQMTTLKSAIC